MKSSRYHNLLYNGSPTYRQSCPNVNVLHNVLASVRKTAGREFGSISLVECSICVMLSI